MNISFPSGDTLSALIFTAKAQDPTKQPVDNQGRPLIATLMDSVTNATFNVHLLCQADFENAREAGTWDTTDTDIYTYCISADGTSAGATSQWEQVVNDIKNNPQDIGNSSANMEGTDGKIVNFTFTADQGAQSVSS